MMTDELIPSPLKTTFVRFASGYKLAARIVGAMRRPYAMTSHGTSCTEEMTGNDMTIATNATTKAPFHSFRLAIAAIAAAVAPAAARPIRTCSDDRVPIVGIRKRLKTNAPRIEPAVLAA